MVGGCGEGDGLVGLYREPLNRGNCVRESERR